MSKQTSFKAKLLLVQLLAIIPLLLFIFYLLDLWLDVSRSRVIDNSIDQAKLIANTVEESFGRAANSVVVVSTDPFVKTYLQKDPAMVSATLKIITTNIKDINALNISNTSGKTIAYSDELTQEQKDSISLADREYFQEVIRTKKPVVSDPLIGRFRGFLSVIMAAPIIEDDKVIAVVAGAFDLETLKSKLEKVLPEDNKRLILLYDNKGRLAIILHKPLPKEEEKLLFNNLPFLVDSKKNFLQILENQKLPSSDKIYLGASLPVDNLGWNVVYLESEEDAFTPLFKVQGITWLVLLVALLFALSVISYYLRKVKLIY